MITSFSEVTFIDTRQNRIATRGGEVQYTEHQDCNSNCKNCSTQREMMNYIALLDDHFVVIYPNK